MSRILGNLGMSSAACCRPLVARLPRKLSSLIWNSLGVAHGLVPHPVLCRPRKFDATHKPASPGLELHPPTSPPRCRPRVHTAVLAPTRLHISAAMTTSSAPSKSTYRPILPELPPAHPTHSIQYRRPVQPAFHQVGRAANTEARRGRADSRFKLWTPSNNWRATRRTLILPSRSSVARCFLLRCREPVCRSASTHTTQS